MTSLCDGGVSLSTDVCVNVFNQVDRELRKILRKFHREERDSFILANMLAGNEVSWFCLKFVIEFYSILFVFRF